jgi:hypothetical protein
MTFAAAGLFKYLLGRQVEAAEVISEKDAGKERRSAGTATHTEGNLVVEFQVESRGEDAGVGKDVDIGGEDEVVVEAGAKIGVTSGRVDVEVLGRSSVDSEIEGHGETEGVEAGAEVGGGCRKAEVEWPCRGWGGHAGWGWFM